MPRIVGFSGSLRKGSFNTSLLRAAVAACPEGAVLDVASIRDFPLYDADVEAEGVPAVVAALKDRIAQADGVLIVTPEYNQSIPGVLKNAIDWLSRPATDMRRVFGDKAVAVMGATPGRGGTFLSQAALLQSVLALGARPWLGARVHVSGAKDVFGADGELKDETVARLVKRFMGEYVEFLTKRRSLERVPKEE